MNGWNHQEEWWGKKRRWSVVCRHVINLLAFVIHRLTASEPASSEGLRSSLIHPSSHLSFCNVIFLPLVRTSAAAAAASWRRQTLTSTSLVLLLWCARQVCILSVGQSWCRYCTDSSMSALTWPANRVLTKLSGLAFLGQLQLKSQLVDTS